MELNSDTPGSDEYAVTKSTIAVKEDENELRFFLMGKTGQGKSATGNSILGKTLFKSEISLSSVTTDVSIQSINYNGKTLKIMDSPGLFDTKQSETDIAKIVVQAVAQLHPGPHVLLFVLNLTRYTSEDHGVYTRLKALLDDNIKKYIIIVFTHADSLQQSVGNTKSIQQVLQGAPDNLKQLLADCGNRFVLFNNKASDSDNKKQVTDLMSLCHKMMSNNNGQPYECPKYAYVAEQIEAEAKKRLLQVQKLELEQNEHFKQREEQWIKKEAEIEQAKTDIERRERELQSRELRSKELESQEQTQIKALTDKIIVLQQQLTEQQNKQRFDQENEKLTLQVADLTTKLNKREATKIETEEFQRLLAQSQMEKEVIQRRFDERERKSQEQIQNKLAEKEQALLLKEMEKNSELQKVRLQQVEADRLRQSTAAETERQIRSLQGQLTSADTNKEELRRQIKRLQEDLENLERKSIQTQQTNNTDHQDSKKSKTCTIL